MKTPELNAYCSKWSLKEATLLTSTSTSVLYRVLFNEQNAILKIFSEKGKQSESNGSIVLLYFEGNGAVRLLRNDAGAQLLEHADGQQLKALVVGGQDAAATEIMSQVMSKLHSLCDPVPSGLISMETNFQSLFRKASRESMDSIFVAGARIAEKLIASEQEVRVLHGDLHHENVVESSTRGWLAIDPQCLAGERTYDVANAFYNPAGFLSLVGSTETIERRCAIYSKQLKMDRMRVLEFAFAYGCLSAAWHIEDGQSPDDTLQIARKIQLLLKT